jgi:hypothetical protein
MRCLVLAYVGDGDLYALVHAYAPELASLYGGLTCRSLGRVIHTTACVANIAVAAVTVTVTIIAAAAIVAAPDQPQGAHEQRNHEELT